MQFLAVSMPSWIATMSTRYENYEILQCIIQLPVLRIFQAMRKLNCKSPFLSVRYDGLKISHISFTISICIAISLNVRNSFSVHLCASNNSRASE
jgi:hypothetical protein